MGENGNEKGKGGRKEKKGEGAGGRNKVRKGQGRENEKGW